MEQKDKDLLLKDLCGRLPYGVKCYIPEANDTSILAAVLEDGENTLFNFWEDERKIQYWYQLYISEFKPYLFPLSSMTEEQKREYYSLKHEVPVCHYEYGDVVEEFELYDSPESFEYLIENHFDYRGLIPMGLAEDATDKNIY